MAKQPGAELSTKKSIICYFISVNNFLYVIMTLEASWQPTIELLPFFQLKEHRVPALENLLSLSAVSHEERGSEGQPD